MVKPTADQPARASGLAVYKQSVKKLHAPQEFAKEIAALGFPQFDHDQ